MMCISVVFLPWKRFLNFAHLSGNHLAPRENSDCQTYTIIILLNSDPGPSPGTISPGKFCFIFTFIAVLLSNLLQDNLSEYRKSFQLWMLFQNKKFFSIWKRKNLRIFSYYLCKLLYRILNKKDTIVNVTGYSLSEQKHLVVVMADCVSSPDWG